MAAVFKVNTNPVFDLDLEALCLLRPDIDDLQEYLIKYTNFVNNLQGFNLDVDGKQVPLLPSLEDNEALKYFIDTDDGYRMMYRYVIKQFDL